uniref:tRNA-splicing endonuclease subunit Sen54 n=1 Tax=Culex pipiens TaxID=7175 RepID=A0A8D8KT17_CULPI
MTDVPCSGSEVRPPKSLLSGRDLLEHHISTFDVRGLPSKLTCAEEEPDQAEAVQRLKDEFRLLLAQNRVGKADLYSEGEWQRDRKRVRLRRTAGKWNLYGYMEDKVHYLDGYEALHLMEMNRLLVNWNSVLVSLEQAYTLFLGYEESLSLEEYQVYNSLMRAGFYLLKFDCNRKYRPEVTGKELDDETKCVWRNLFEVLRQPNPLIDEEVADEALKDKVSSSMQRFNTAIIFQESSEDLNADVDATNSSDKRKISLSNEEQVTKKYKPEEGYLHKDSETFSKLAKFQQLFKRFDIIRNSLDEAPLGNSNTKLKLLFDMFPSDVTNFKRSEPMLPEYRIVVTTTRDPLPTAADVAHLYRSQPQTAVPILVMRVADTLTIHCFLYSFYRLGRNLVTVRAPERTGRARKKIAVEDDDGQLEAGGSSELLGEGDVVALSE